MALPFLRARAVQDLAPPLQPDLAGHRLLGRSPDPRDLQREGLQRMEMWPPVRRRVQGGDMPVSVMLLHEGRTDGVGVREEFAHGAS